jgi:hypothetical protein
MPPTATAEAHGLSAEQIQNFLAETAKQVKVMKASWLRVAMNLKSIRAHELWRHAGGSCENFEDYAFGVLDLNRTVVRRMLQAMDYTSERRPNFMEEFQRRGEEMDVPSYDTVNQLRRAESSFEGREEDFESLETKVFDEGVGRQSLKKEIDSMLGDDAEEPAQPKTRAQPSNLQEVIEHLKDVEREMLKLDVSAEACRLIFRLVETLEKEA